MNGKFLLVKLAYAHRSWTLPGGKVERRESFQQAALRELQEETNVQTNALELIGEYESRREGKRDTVQCFYGTTTSASVKIDPLEIADANWFARSDFPPRRSGRVDQIMDLYDRRPP